jgi:hypothetical protein
VGSGDEADETPVEPPPRIQYPGFQKASDISRTSSSGPAGAAARAGLGHVELTDETEVETIERPIANKSTSYVQPIKSKQFGFKAPALGGGQKPLRIGLGSSSRSTLGNNTTANQVNGAYKPVAFKVPELPKRSPVPDSSDPPSIPNELSDPSDPNSHNGPGNSSDPPRQDIVDIDSSGDDSDNPDIVNETMPEETAKSTTNIISAKTISAPRVVDEPWGETDLSAPTVAKSNPLGMKRREVFYPAAPRKEKIQDDPASDGEVDDLSDAVKKSRELTEAKARVGGRSGTQSFIQSFLYALSSIVNTDHLLSHFHVPTFIPTVTQILTFQFAVSPDDSDDLEVECPFTTKIPVSEIRN